jgi:hypothetical protein
MKKLIVLALLALFMAMLATPVNAARGSRQSVDPCAVYQDDAVLYELCLIEEGGGKKSKGGGPKKEPKINFSRR